MNNSTNYVKEASYKPLLVIGYTYFNTNISIHAFVYKGTEEILKYRQSHIITEFWPCNELLKLIGH